MENIFFDIGFIIIVATILAYIARLFKQPLIPAYILGGVIIGPFLGLITNTEVIATLSEIGIAFLLFIVGLEIDIRKLKDVGLVASLGGIIQVVSIFTLAFVAALLFGFFAMEAIYIGLIIALSSTMVVIKLLSDKKEIDTLHGKIIIGILLLQDLVAIIALSVLVSLGKFTVGGLFFAIIKGVIVLVSAIIISKYVFPSLFRFAAKSQELLFISSVSISFLYAIAFNYFGFSIAIGAFIAGVSLANLPYNLEIIGKIKSLRDFFSVMFFVSLGMNLVLGNLKTMIIPLLIFLFLATIAKPVIIIFTTAFFGYKKRTSFLTANYLAQISEFSLIIAAQGLLLGHISQEIFSMSVMLAIITITFTTYFVKMQSQIYHKVEKYLSVFDNFSENKEDFDYIPKSQKSEIILCGYDRISYNVVKTLKKMKKSMLVIDYNPETIKHLKNQKVPCLYGDIGDTEILERLNLKKASMIISTVSSRVDNTVLIKTARKDNPDIIIFVTANKIRDALDFYDSGADYVVLPNFLGGDYLSLMIEDFTGKINKLIENKVKHIKELKERHHLGHEHPHER